MHAAARKYVGHFKTKEPISVIEIGSLNVNGTIRDLFPNAKWTGIDRLPGPCVDVVTDAEHFQPAETVDVVICCEVLEHASNWPQLIQKAADWLKPGGIFIMTCAGPGRKEHSVNGGPLQFLEYYRNLDSEEIADTMRRYEFMTVTDGSSDDDTRVCARKTAVPHIMCIQMAYTDEALSRRRMDIAQHTLIPSLQYQTRPPQVHAAVSRHDPLLHERMKWLGYQLPGVRFVFWDEWQLYGGDWLLDPGRKIVSRCDDDDVLSRDFCAVVYHSGCHTISDTALLWPRGYVWFNQEMHVMEHPGNQFVSLATSGLKTPHDQGHWLYRKQWPARAVSYELGWIWVRHGDAATPTLRKYRSNPVRGIDAARFPIDLPAIERAKAASGPGHGSYTAHNAAKAATPVFVHSVQPGDKSQ